MNKTLRSRIPKWVLDPVLPILLILFTIGIALYYITGPMLVMFNSDYADSLIWANVTAETGDILSSDFHYAAILPFGAPLWMVPILKIFGFGITAQVLSMAVFAIIFIPSVYFFFRSLKWKRLSAAASTACFCLVMTGSDVLLEMFWGHTIYYSLGLLFWMLLMGLTLRLVDTSRSWKKGDKISIRTILELSAVAILCAGCATNGFQVLALGVVPVAGALVACAFFDQAPLVNKAHLRKVALVGLMLVAIAVGFVILMIITKNGSIQAKYANAHMVWGDSNNWIANVMKIFPSAAYLFGVAAKDGLKLMSVKSVFYALKLLALMVIFVSPVIMFLRYKKLKENAKTVLWSHLIVTCVIGFMYVFGPLSYGNWRLIPCLSTGLIVTVLWIKDLLAGTRVEKRIAAALAVLMAAVCLINVLQVARMPRNIQKNVHWEVTQVLKEKGYDYGFATFWNSHPIVFLSDSEIQVTSVKQEGVELEPHMYQNFKQEFQPREDKDTCFLMLEKSEYANVQKGEYWKRLNSTRKLVDSFECGKFIVLVYDGCIIV